jgi:hypothetical protein
MNGFVSRSVVRSEFRHSNTVVLAVLCLLTACEGELPISADIYVPIGAPKSCTGAYAANSKACWEEGVDGGDEGPIQQNLADAQERIANLGADRCAGGILGAPGTPGMLSVSFSTVKLGGMYTPNNCGAVWIEDANGFYVRTLNVWAGERQPSVVAWAQGACSKDLTIADVITSATLPGPSAHTATWDMRDWRGAVVPDATFTLLMQVMENETFPEGPVFKVDIPKGPAPWQWPNATTEKNPTPGFEHIMVTYTPSGAAAPPVTTP